MTKTDKCPHGLPGEFCAFCLTPVAKTDETAYCEHEWSGSLHDPVCAGCGVAFNDIPKIFANTASTCPETFNLTASDVQFRNWAYWRIKEIETENKQLREALEWYAKDEIYVNRCIGKGMGTDGETFDMYSGIEAGPTKARIALKDKGHE